MTIYDLIKERDASIIKFTTQILDICRDKLTKAFSTIYKTPDLKVEWIDAMSVPKYPKLLDVRGKMAMKVGEKAIIGSDEIIITEENMHIYSKFSQFVFPINLLEYGSVEDLINYVGTISKTVIAPDDTKTIHDYMVIKYDEFDEMLLNNPELLENATKPADKIVAGFSTEGMNPEHIAMLGIYENDIDKVLH